MAGFNVKVRFEDSGISTDTAAAHPILQKRGKGLLYIYAPTGMIRATDKVRFARYVSSKNGRRKGTNKRHIKHCGWIRPKRYEKGKAVQLVNTSLLLDTNASNAVTECWALLINGNCDIPSALFSIMSEQAGGIDLKKEIVLSDLQLFTDFFGKQLGVCIERNGVQITDYMPFACGITYSRKVPENNGNVVLSMVFSNSLYSLREFAKQTEPTKKRTNTP